MKRIAIVGSGNFGANAACFIAEKRLANVILVDKREGLARGKALDLMEAAPVRGFDVQVDGADAIEAIRGSDVVVLAAGVSRKLEVNDEDLLADNLSVLDEVLPQIRDLARPDATLIIQREPAAPLVMAAVERYGFAPRQVIGVTGLVETARFRYFMAETLGVSDQDTAGMAIGGSRELALPLIQYANVSGVPLAELATPQQIEEIVDRTRRAEDEVLARLRLTSAYYAPAAVLSELLLAVLGGKQRYLSATVVAQGQYGLNDVALTLPILAGPGGVEQILELTLTEDQAATLREAAAASDRLAGMIDDLLRKRMAV